MNLLRTIAQNFDVIIIGGGPAGAQCALWLKLLGYNPVILEKAASLGGLQRISTFENHWLVCVPGHLGNDIASAIQANIQRHGVSFVLNVADLQLNCAKNIFNAKFRNNFGSYDFQAPKLVIATGAQYSTGGFTRSEKIIIGSGSNLLNKNFKGKKIAILGGGDSAFEIYPTIVSQGSSSVKIFARSLKARKQLVDLVPSPSVHLGNYEVDEKALTVNGEHFDLFCVLYGWEPVNPLPKSFGVETLAKGFIRVDANRRTTNPNIFAIGECTQFTHPCVTTSMADGVIAAKAIERDFIH